MNDLLKIRKMLSRYSKKNIIFNEPHVTIRCIQRNITKEQVKDIVMNPDNLVLAYKAKSVRSDEDKYELFFKLSSNKTLKLPVVFKSNKLYIITVIVRWRKWQAMIRKKHI